VDAANQCLYLEDGHRVLALVEQDS
jgi:hypothetical protein